jgi:hypothetical protein
MSLPNALWQHVRHLPLNGFNPAPIASAGRIWASSRLKNGSNLTELHPETLQPLDNPRLIHPNVEDIRWLPGSWPPIGHGCVYGPPPVQVLIIIDPTAPQPRPLAQATVLRIQHARNPERPKAEKNWLLTLPPAQQPQLWYHAQPCTIANNLGHPHAWTVAQRHPWPSPQWAANIGGEIRLSTAPIEIATRQLFWMWHLKDSAGGYWSGANLSEANPPWRPTHTTAEPLFTPFDASDVSPYWPPNRCIFPMQTNLLPDSTLRVWAGDADRHSLAIEAPLASILARMKPLRTPDQ